MSKEKAKTSVAPFAAGDMVAYNGHKKRYLSRVGLVYKVKLDTCLVQFFDEPVTPDGGMKVSQLSFKDLRQHRPLSIPKPQLPPTPSPLP